MPHTITNKFTFPGAAQSLVASQQQILDFINSNLPGHANAANIGFKVKMILAELLNNALKHVGNAATTIHVFIDDENIKIEKSDYGNRFNPDGLISNNPPGVRVILCKDPLHYLYALIERPTLIRFFCEENNDSNAFDVNDIIEHFGLLIITKSSDEFSYRHDQASGLNTFAIQLKLR